MEQVLIAPKNSGELRPFLDHVWILIKGNWRRQVTVKNCNKKACWDLLTHPNYAGIHKLERCEKQNFKGSTQFFSFDPSTETWLLIV